MRINRLISKSSRVVFYSFASQAHALHSHIRVVHAGGLHRDGIKSNGIKKRLNYGPGFYGRMRAIRGIGSAIKFSAPPQGVVSGRTVTRALPLVSAFPNRERIGL
ncbi:hypothetical protein [Bradyrhizobium sp.]|uniref:hypothetical protein n=1 Tax=Bradyrhizobium sp. TaxID=376 RepID=UPI003C72A8B7